MKKTINKRKKKVKNIKSIEKYWIKVIKLIIKIKTKW